jgi:hypothetical protein
MLAKFVRSSRINRSPAALVSVVVAAVLVGAGGWAAAGFAGRDRAGGPELTSVALHAANGAVLPTSMTAAKTSGRLPASTAGPAATAAYPIASQVTSNKLPVGLVALTPQAALSAALRAGSAGSANDAVTGGGSTTFFSLGFTAQSHRNGNNAGTVSGNAQFNFPPPNGGALHVQVNCVQVVGADAYVSGTLMKPAFGLSAGTVILFGVEDGDTGSKADLMSDIYFTLSSTISCHAFHPAPHYAVQGNIELH